LKDDRRAPHCKAIELHIMTLDKSVHCITVKTSVASARQGGSRTDLGRVLGVDTVLYVFESTH